MREAIRAALAAAGAGHVGDYDTVSYSVAGEGRFRPLAGANPTVGTVGELEVTDELRIEALLPRARRADVVRAVLAAHSYEEVAYDVLELADPGDRRHRRRPDRRRRRDHAGGVRRHRGGRAARDGARGARRR